MQKRAVVVVLLLVACRPALEHVERPPQVPRDLAYPVAEATAYLSESLAPLVPSVDGAITVFAVSPPLPAGLTFDATTGAIAGIPQVLAARARYTVTATNDFGLTTTTIDLTVVERPPTAITYAMNTLALQRGGASPSLAPMWTGGAPRSFRVSPPLPLGLAVDPESGVLSGAAVVTSAMATYTIFGANDFGAASTEIAIVVTEPPPSLAFLGSPFVFLVGELVHTGPPHNTGGQYTTCSLSAGQTLPEGLSLDGDSCDISGFPSKQSVEREITLDVTSPSGPYAFTVRIAVAGTLRISPPTVSMTASVAQTVTLVAQQAVGAHFFRQLSGPGEVTEDGVYSNGRGAGQAIIEVVDARGRTAQAVIDNARVLTMGAIYSSLIAGTDLYLGGSFDRVNPDRAGRIAALDVRDGTVDRRIDFANGFDAPVRAIVVDGDAIFVGGEFTTYRGQPARYLAKIDANTGALDTKFTKPQGFNGAITGLAVSGTAVYACGYFTAYRGQVFGSLAKLDRDTGAPATGFGAHGFNSVSTVLLVAHGALYVGGAFTTYASQAVGGLVRLDLETGALDPDYIGGSTQGSVNALAATPDALFVGGNFNLLRGTAIDVLARVTPDTGAVEAWTANVTGGDVRSILINGDALYAGGSMAGPGAGIIKVSVVNGAPDAVFNAVPQTARVAALAAASDGLVVGGALTGYGGSSTKHQLLKVTYDGATAVTGLPGGADFDSDVSALAVAGSRLYVGGAFRSVHGTPAGNMAKISLIDGTPDALVTKEGAFDDDVLALAIDGTDLFVGGRFTAYRGSSRNRLAKINAMSGDPTPGFPTSVGVNAVPPGNIEVRALTRSGASLFVGGAFNRYTGPSGMTSADNLLKIDTANGALDTSFVIAGNGFDKPTNALASNGTSLFVGGEFNSYRGGGAARLAKLTGPTGALDPSFLVGASGATGGAIHALHLVTGGNLIAGGMFTAFDDGSALPPFAVHLAILNPTSGKLSKPPSTFPQLNGAVTALGSSGTSVYVAGAFTRYHPGEVSELPVGGIMRFNPLTGAADALFSHPIGLAPVESAAFSTSRYPRTLALGGTSVFVGGDVMSYDGVPAMGGVLLDDAGERVDF